MSFRTDLANFLHQLEEESNASNDLWTWLPSYQAAKKGHGDRALNVRPDNARISLEATSVLILLISGIEMPEEFFRCPCEDCWNAPGLPSVATVTAAEWARGVNALWLEEAVLCASCRKPTEES